MGSSCSTMHSEAADDGQTPPPSVVSIAIQTDTYPIRSPQPHSEQVTNPLAPNAISLDPSDEVVETVEYGSSGETMVVVRGTRGTDRDTQQFIATAPNSRNTLHSTHDADADDDNSNHTMSHSDTQSKAAQAPLSPQTLHFPTAAPQRIATATIRDEYDGGDTLPTPQHANSSASHAMRAHHRANGEAQQTNSSTTANVVFQSFYLGPSFEAHPTAQASSGNYSSGAFPSPATAPPANGGKQVSIAAVTTSMNGYVGESTSFRTRGTSLSSAATELKSSTETNTTATSGSERTTDSFGANPNKQPGGALPPQELKLVTFYQR